MIENVIWIEAMTHRPAMRWRTSRSASVEDSRSKRSASAALRPIVLPRRIPDTDSDSSTSVDMSAIVPCRLEVIFCRWFPTRRVR
jgi:hypothetical protein